MGANCVYAPQTYLCEAMRSPTFFCEKALCGAETMAILVTQLCAERTPSINKKVTSLPMIRRPARRRAKFALRIAPANRKIFVAWVALLAGALAYVSFFHEALQNYNWMDVKGYTRILIPDSFLYIGLVDDIHDLEWTQFAIAGVKNAFGPALVWIAGGASWYGVAAVNSVLALATAIYTVRICRHFGISPNRTSRIAMTLILLPVMLYYCIGPAKELPTLTALTAFYYHFTKRQLLPWIAAAATMVLFRYQLVAVIVPFIVIARFAKNPLRTAVQLMVVIAMAYPVFAQLGIINPGESALFREGGESRFGAAIENVRNTIPVASGLAVAVRMGQAVMEPVANVLRSESIIENGSFSVIAFVYFISLLPVLPYWFRTVRRIVTYYRIKSDEARDQLSLYAMIALFVVPVGGFSFVHHRYLFPITALVLIAGHRKVRTEQSQAMLDRGDLTATRTS